VAERTFHGWKRIARCDIASTVARGISDQGLYPSNRLYAGEYNQRYDAGMWRVTVTRVSIDGFVGDAEVTARQGRMTVTFEDIAAES
jgi:hypothetical protein